MTDEDEYRKILDEIKGLTKKAQELGKGRRILDHLMLQNREEGRDLLQQLYDNLGIDRKECLNEEINSNDDAGTGTSNR